jgi:hypothetical protein
LKSRGDAVGATDAAAGAGGGEVVTLRLLMKRGGKDDRSRELQVRD